MDLPGCLEVAAAPRQEIGQAVASLMSFGSLIRL